MVARESPVQGGALSSSNRPRRCRAAGFTLIELLVVIAIVMLLVAITLPVAMRAARSARDTNCISNLRQVAFGFQGYLNQFEGIFPPHKSYNSAAPYWFDLILPYMRDQQVFGCPVLRKWKWEFHPHLLGYGYNAYWLGLWWHTDVAPSADLADTGRWSRFWRKVDEVAEPSKCSLVGDTRRKPDGSWSSSLWWPNSAQEGVDPRHGDSGMVVFVDGHACRMYPKDMNDLEPWAPYPSGCSLSVRQWYDPLRPLNR